MSGNLNEIMQDVVAFREDRNWAQFHTPRQLSTALSIEAAELQEVMLWKDDAAINVRLHEEPFRTRLSHEIADVLIYALLLSHATGIDPTDAIREKLIHNAEKYPVEKSKGNATKYHDFDSK